MDMHLPDGNGLDLLGQVLPTHRPLQGLLTTGRATLEAVLDAAKLGICDFITKPFNRETLLRVVQSAVRGTFGRLPGFINFVMSFKKTRQLE